MSTVTNTLLRLVRRLRVEGGYLPNALIMSPEGFKDLLNEAGTNFRINPDPDQGGRGYLVSLPTVRVYVHEVGSEGLRFYETEITNQTDVLDLVCARPIVGLYTDGTLWYGDRATLRDPFLAPL